MPTRSKWTLEEDNLLIELYKNKNVKIKSLLTFFNGRTYLSLKRRIQILNIGKKENPDSWSEIDIQQLKNIYENMDIKINDIIKQFPNRNWNSIKQKANSLNLIRRKNMQYTVNENYFQDIKNIDQAYYLGYIAADASVYNKTFKFKINIKDQEIIYNLNKVLLNGYTPKIYEKENTIGIQIVNENLLYYLSKYNIIYQKTMNYTWPGLLPENLEMPFILGYFDGDGSLHKRKNKSGNSWVWQLYGRFDFLISVKSKIENHLNIKLKDPYKAAGKELYNLSISGKKAMVIDQHMTQYDIGLKRKRIQYYWEFHDKGE